MQAGAETMDATLKEDSYPDAQMPLGESQSASIQPSSQPIPPNSQPLFGMGSIEAFNQPVELTLDGSIQAECQQLVQACEGNVASPTTVNSERSGQETPLSSRVGSNEESPAWDDLSGSEQNAITQFAKARGKETKDVKLSDVSNSPEGMLHWACQGQNWGSRSPLSQAFGRAIAHHPKFQDMYKSLTDPLKLEFKKTWGLQRNWQFTKESKTIDLSYSKSEEEAGEMMTIYQVAAALGIGAFPQPGPERDAI